MRGVWNWTVKERIWQLRIKNAMDDMHYVHSLELLGVTWSPVFAFSKSLVAASVLNQASVDARRN